jgi:hypothetical protein
MKLGRIVGTVVSTRKDPSLDSLKLLIVENLTTDLGREGWYVVAGRQRRRGVGRSHPLRDRKLGAPNGGDEGSTGRRGDHGNR